MAPRNAWVIRLCLYRTLSEHDRLLRSSLVSKLGVVARLVKRLDELPPYLDGVHCPEDRGAEVLAILRYAGPHSVEVHISLEGCDSVTNGQVLRSTWPLTSNVGQVLEAELNQLV